MSPPASVPPVSCNALPWQTWQLLITFLSACFQPDLGRKGLLVRSRDSVTKIRGQLNQHPGLVVASVRVRVLSECRSEHWSLWISSSSGTLILLPDCKKLFHSLVFSQFFSLSLNLNLQPHTPPTVLPFASLLWFPPDISSSILAATELGRSHLWPFKKQGISYLISATLPAVTLELAHPNLELEKKQSQSRGVGMGGVQECVPLLTLHVNSANPAGRGFSWKQMQGWGPVEVYAGRRGFAFQLGQHWGSQGVKSELGLCVIFKV